MGQCDLGVGPQKKTSEPCETETIKMCLCYLILQLNINNNNILI